MLACDHLQTLLGQLSADLCLRVSRPTNGLAAKLGPWGRLEPAHNGSATIVIPREQVDEKNRLNETLYRILELLDQSHVDLRDVKTSDANLERLFLKMTGSRLRD